MARAVDLPQPAFGGMLVEISSHNVYVMGRYEKYGLPIEPVYTCSLNALLQTCILQSFGASSARSSDLSSSNS